MQLPQFESLCAMLVDYPLNLLLSFVLGVVHSVFAVPINWWMTLTEGEIPFTLKQLKDMQWNVKIARSKENLCIIFSMSMMHLSQAERHNHDIAYKAIAVLILFMTVQ